MKFVEEFQQYTLPPNPAAIQSVIRAVQIQVITKEEKISDFKLYLSNQLSSSVRTEILCWEQGESELLEQSIISNGKLGHLTILNCQAQD